MLSHYSSNVILKILENVSKGIMITDTNKKMVGVNPAFEFVSGYSSLSCLVRFSLDVLKIVRSFIQYICSLDDKQAIVDAIIQMAHRLKLNVVAEGLESTQQVELLREMGCDYIQGYYYSKPYLMNELLDFLQFWEIEHQGRINV